MMTSAHLIKQPGGSAFQLKTITSSRAAVTSRFLVCGLLLLQQQLLLLLLEMGCVTAIFR